MHGLVYYEYIIYFSLLHLLCIFIVLSSSFPSVRVATYKFYKINCNSNCICNCSCNSNCNNKIYFSFSKLIFNFKTYIYHYNYLHQHFSNRLRPWNYLHDNSCKYWWKRGVGQVVMLLTSWFWRNSTYVIYITEAVAVRATARARVARASCVVHTACVFQSGCFPPSVSN